MLQERQFRQTQIQCKILNISQNKIRNMIKINNTTKTMTINNKMHTAMRFNMMKTNRLTKIKITIRIMEKMDNNTTTKATINNQTKITNLMIKITMITKFQTLMSIWAMIKKEFLMLRDGERKK